MDRRRFLLSLGGATLGCGALCGAASGAAEAAGNGADGGQGMLVDTTACIGCRKCEYACAEANKLTGLPLEAYEDKAVFEQPRRMTKDAFTVVNRYPEPRTPDKPAYVKIQCMHCKEPACVSACLVRALERQPNGAVAYDAWRCMGCRYCMVACPFQVPSYEYDKAFTPRVRKCTFCNERVTKEGRPPACMEICPTNCMTFAKRDELIKLAHEKITANPERYHNEVYGEYEVGGTAWLYLTGRPADELGMLKLGSGSVTRLPETVQHSIFKGGLPPLLLLGALGLAMKAFAPGEVEDKTEKPDESAGHSTEKES